MVRVSPKRDEEGVCVRDGREVDGVRERIDIIAQIVVIAIGSSGLVLAATSAPSRSVVIVALSLSPGSVPRVRFLAIGQGVVVEIFAVEICDERIHMPRSASNPLSHPSPSSSAFHAGEDRE
jgi:hypothetical protein